MIAKRKYMRTSCTFSMKIKLHRAQLSLKNLKIYHFFSWVWRMNRKKNTLINIMRMFSVSKNFNVFKLHFQLIMRKRRKYASKNVHLAWHFSPNLFESAIWCVVFFSVNPFVNLWWRWCCCCRCCCCCCRCC